MLASGGSDTTTLLWDVSAALRPEPAGSKRLSAADLAQYWAWLGDADPARSYVALWALAAAPGQAVPLLGKHLRPIPPADARRLARLINDLGDEEFETRSRAMRQLEALAELAGPALRKALAAAADVDVKLRLQLLLGRIDSGEMSPEQRRAARALHVLELAGTPAARRVLGELAKGSAGARLTREARACVERLERRGGGGGKR